MYDDLIRRLRESADWADHFAVLMGRDRDVASPIKREAADAIEELIAALTASNEVIARSKPKWIPVTERLPEIRIWVLTYRPALEAIWPAYLSSFGDWIDEDGIPIEVTHWMPLPEPPEEDKRCVTS